MNQTDHMKPMRTANISTKSISVGCIAKAVKIDQYCLIEFESQGTGERWKFGRTQGIFKFTVRDIPATPISAYNLKNTK